MSHSSTSNPGRAVLFLDHASGLGGAERSLLGLLAHLRQGWDCHLAGVDGPLLDQASEFGISIHPIELPRLRGGLDFFSRLRRSAESIQKIVHAHQIRAIYTNTVRATFFGQAAARRSGVPLVWHMRDFWLSESRPQLTWGDTALKRFLLNRSALVIANSAATASYLPPSSKVHVVHNGIDISQFDPAQGDPDRFREVWGIPKEAPLVGMAGRFRPWKGQSRFIEMAAALQRRNPDARFVIIGGNPLQQNDAYLAKCHALVEKYGLASHLQFAGHIAPIADALAALDLFIHPGDPEPFGLVNIEALAMQTPVIAFAHGALPEILQPDVTGLLIPPNDIEAMAKAVDRMLRSPDKRAKMGQIGRQDVMSRFPIEATAAKIDGLLNDLLSKRSS